MADKSKEAQVKKYKSLEKEGIPYRIEFSDALVEYLMRIAECRPFLLESLSRPLQVSLIRSAKVRAVTYSNQIEGNPLAEAEVERVLKKRKPQEDKSELEIQNYYGALKFTEKLAYDSRPISINDFSDVQRLVTSGLIAKSQLGKPRTIPVSILNVETGQTIDACPDPHRLKDLLAELWEWLGETHSKNPFLRSFAFHFMAVAVHPFADGNGRSARLMQHLLLLRSGEEVVKYVPSETTLMRHREDYYLAIRESKKLESLLPFLEFMAKCFSESAEEITKEAKGLIQKESRTPQKRRSGIIEFAKKKGTFRTSDLVANFPNIPRRTLERDLEYLCRNKELNYKGEQKGRVYFV